MNVLRWFLLSSLVAMSGCPLEDSKVQGGRKMGGVFNYAASVKEHHGRLLRDNPIILSGNANLEHDVDINSLLGIEEDFITEEQFLFAPCQGGGALVEDCFEVRSSPLAKLLPKNERTWAFDGNTDEFLQVNTFGHVKMIIRDFHDKLAWMFGQALPGHSPLYPTALPGRLFDSNHDAFWLGPAGKLQIFSNCGVSNNAYYDPAGNTICLGHDSHYPRVRFAQDPTVIYHEVGHALNQIALNFRNRFDADLVAESSLGYLFYDEAGSIDEGICDYASFAMNGRTHFAEWAIGRFLRASRPMSEDDPLHAVGISTNSSERLSYPEYVFYDPNNAQEKVEDIHNAGQIISHYLVALTRDFQETCQMNRPEATRAVQQLLVESLAELGSQTGSARDLQTDGVNLIKGHGIEWLSKARAINFRNFAQVMAKNIYNIYSNADLARCGGDVYPKDRIETLLDDYGLLLFPTYNLDGNGHTPVGNTVSGRTGPVVKVNPTNRRYTVMLPKELLMLDPGENATKAFIFDNGSDMLSVLQNMQSSGQVGTLSSEIDANLAYNNNNGRISPGELVGISLNLYNDANSPMGGVHLLASDWDQAKNAKPCNTLGDNWPQTFEGAADTTGESGGNPGECAYTTRTNGGEAQESLAPVCWALINDGGASKWASQARLMEEMGLDPSRCLGGEGDSADCFVRALKGADHAFFGRIDPKQTWAKTIAGEGELPLFNSGNVIFFEISPWTPPGSEFRCRLRARFSNCSDCWTNAEQNDDDYLDYRYAGAKPFKLLHFQFSVID